MKREYETVWEIFNLCSNNQMRDVFINEISLDPDQMDEYVKNKIRDKELHFEKTVNQDGSVIYEIDASGIRERFSFTPID